MPRAHGLLKDAKSLKDVLVRLGDIPPERVRLHPFPGTATERDLLHVLDRENIPCELIDGVLVEKAMGAPESFVAVELGFWLRLYLQDRPIGVVFGADATLRIMPRLIRLPDVSFVSTGRLPGGLVSAEPVPDLVPDLAVEILSENNTRSEMLRKRKEFFLAGTQLIWIVDPNKRTVEVYSSPDESVKLSETDTLTGGSVLPGFVLPVQSLFTQLTKRASPRPGRRKRKKP